MSVNCEVTHADRANNFKIVFQNVSHSKIKSHAIYELTCPRVDCELYNLSYIGQTRNSILTMLNQHKQNGAILEHMVTCHNVNILTIEDLTSKSQNHENYS